MEDVMLKSTKLGNQDEANYKGNGLCIRQCLMMYFAGQLFVCMIFYSTVT